MLEFVDWQPTGSLEPLPAGETLLTALAKESQVIALVTIVGTSGQMKPDGRWIHTRVNARIDQLLKSDAVLQSHDTIEFLTSGGTVKVRGASGKEQEIRAVRQGARDFVVGRAYFVFAQRTGSGLVVARSDAAEVNGDRLTPLSSDYGAPLAGVSRDDVSSAAALASVK